MLWRHCPGVPIWGQYAPFLTQACTQPNLVRTVERSKPGCVCLATWRTAVVTLLLTGSSTTKVKYTCWPSATLPCQPVVANVRPMSTTRLSYMWATPPTGTSLGRMWTTHTDSQNVLLFSTFWIPRYTSLSSLHPVSWMRGSLQPILKTLYNSPRVLI